jgi:Undecaprenyl-phosphate glucose phosphotransferase
MANLYLPDVDKNTAEAWPRQTSSAAHGRRLERILAKIIIIEFLSIVIVCFLTSNLYFYAVLTSAPGTLEYVSAALLIAILIILLSLGLKQYVAIQAWPRDRFMLSGLGAVALGFSLFLSLLFLFKIGDWYSRATFFAQFFSVGATILVTRAMMHSYVRRAIRSGAVEARKAILIGDAKSNSYLVSRLQRQGVHCSGSLSFPYVHGYPTSDAEVAPTNQFFSAWFHYLNSNRSHSPAIRNFVERCRAYKPDDVIFLADIVDLPRIAALVGPLSELPVSVHVIPTASTELWASARATNLGETAAIQVLRPPLSWFDLSIKRVFDICASAVGLLFLSPLMLTVALGVKLESPGPVLFRQSRHGYNNEIIPVVKFRTMGVLEDGESTETFTQARANDARLTRLGRVLRRTNIDELPQLINVLRGEMSLIGPRPHPIALNAMFRERIVPYSRRHNVKPGLTGWAQVNGLRGETDTFEKMQRRVEYDMFYVDNWSFLFDLKILLMTLFSKSAYHNAG